MPPQRAVVSAIILAVVLAFGSGWSSVSCGFMDSEDQQFKGEIKEAIGRARDFNATIGEREREEAARERYGNEEIAEHERTQRAQEARREAFVAERNAKPSEEATKDWLERDDDIRKAKEAQQMEANRKEYIKKRNDARSIIERDAHIDENREYGL